MGARDKFGICRLCGCERPLTFHHLIPRTLHRRQFFRKHFSREVLNRGIDICRLCHNGIHDRFDKMTLAKQFNTHERLMGDETLARHVAWSARQKKA